MKMFSSIFYGHTYIIIIRMPRKNHKPCNKGDRYIVSNMLIPRIQTTSYFLGIYKNSSKDYLFLPLVFVFEDKFKSIHWYFGRSILCLDQEGFLLIYFYKMTFVKTWMNVKHILFLCNTSPDMIFHNFVFIT